jgi:YggT family protein
MGDVMIRQATLAIASTLAFLLTTYRWIVIGSVLLSWVNPDPYNPIVRFLRGVTEPVFYQVRRRLPFVVLSGIDLSPIVVLLGVEVLRTVIVGSLYELAFRLAAAATAGALG